MPDTDGAGLLYASGGGGVLIQPMQILYAV